MNCDLVNVQPAELKFPFELRKQSSCSMQLTNKTDEYVALKVKTTNPKKYCVRPNTGVILPRASCNVTVTMQAQQEAPPDMQSKDKFLVQSVTAPDGTTSKDIVPEMFNKEDGKIVEFKLRVVYIPADPPSPVPEGSEEGYSPRASSLENRNQNISSFDDAWSVISKLTEEKTCAMQQNQKLRQELELMRKESSKGRAGGLSLLFVLLFGLLGVLVGYLVKRT